MDKLVAGNHIPHRRIKGLSLPEITLGTAQLGIKGYSLAAQSDPVNTEAILEACLSSGIDCFDTAPSYGDAEKKLGTFFKNRPDPIFVTKVKVLIGSQTDEKSVARHIFRQVEKSMKNLGVGRIPVLLLHDPEILSSFGETVTRCFEEMISNGWIGRAGISLGGEPDREYRKHRQWIEQDIFEVLQIPMNIMDQRMIHRGFFQEIRNMEKIVFVRSVFLKGLFFSGMINWVRHCRKRKNP